MSDLTKQVEEIILGAVPNAQVMVRDPIAVVISSQGRLMSEDSDARPEFPKS